MQCPSCGAFTSEQDAFCGECGRPMAKTPLPADALSPLDAKDLPTLDLDSLTEPPSPPPKRFPLVPVLLGVGVALLALCLCGVGAMVFLEGIEEPTPIPTPTPVPIPTSAPTPTPVESAGTGKPVDVVVGNVPIYSDDFSDPDSGWDVFSEDDTLAEYVDGEYRIGVYHENYMAWGNPNPSLELTDFAVDVEARLIEGPVDNNLGLVIRDQGDEDNFYWYEISSDGYFSVDLMLGGEWATLVSWEQSEAINQGVGATNRLKVICSGTQCSFYVNDVWLTDVVDDNFTSGTIGLAAGAFDEPDVVVHFDNLAVYELQE